MLACIGGIGTWEMFFLVFLVLIFFGAKKLPELARGLGRGIREFKDASREVKDHIEEGIKEEPTKAK